MSAAAGTLEAVGAYLEAARAEFEAYTESGQVTALLADAQDLIVSALDKLRAFEDES